MLRRNRVNVSSGYNAGVRESDYYTYAMLRCNETYDDADAVANTSEGHICKKFKIIISDKKVSPSLTQCQNNIQILVDSSQPWTWG